MSLSVSSILIVLIALGIYARQKTTSLSHRRWMMFPEHNPEPVMCVSLDGQVRYANPAARVLENQLADKHPGHQLLPPDLPGQIAKLVDSGQTHDQWRYLQQANVFECSLHCMKDLGVCHVYLKDLTSLHVAETLLNHNILHDSLTGLPNKSALQEQLDATLLEGRLATILLLQLDRFHNFATILGQDTSNRLLLAVATRLASLETAVPGSVLFHLKENLLVLFWPYFSDDRKLFHLAVQVKTLMAPAFHIDSRELYFSLNMGSSRAPVDGSDTSTLLRCADTALQHSKRNGSLYQPYYPALEAQAVERLELEHSLAHAVERGELTLRYQPQYRIQDGRMVGVEALVRWNHPTRGEVPPSDFIPLAEASGAIFAIDEWVLNSACERNRAWQNAGLPPLTISVNLSPRHLSSPTLVQRVEWSLARSGMPASWLELEITESAAIHDFEQATTNLGKLRESGIKLALDDFGTGYSALTWLRRLPIDKVKIDKSFTHLMRHNRADATIVRAVVLLGRKMGLTVLAEGVEELSQLEMLRSMRCTQVQGYLFSRPLTETQLLDLLQPKQVSASETPEPLLQP